MQIQPGHGLDQVLEDLANRHIGTLLIEGGAKILCTFLDQNLWDECRIIKSGRHLGTGIAAPVMTHHPNHCEEWVNDRILQYFNPLI